MPSRNNDALHPNALLVLDALRKHQASGNKAMRLRDLKQSTGLRSSQTNLSLRVLRERGLASNPSYGHWAAKVRAVSLSPQAFSWLETTIAQCAGVGEGMDNDDPVGVELMLAKHHLVAALERARG